MDFQFQALGHQQFSPLYGKSDKALRDLGVIVYEADADTGFPCRVSLENARAGERVLLLNHEHLAVDTPYRARHAIFIRDGATTRQYEINQIPDMFSDYLLSVRAFDADHMIIDAEIADGKNLETIINGLLRNPGTALLHIHTARYGCYLGKVTRAGTPD